MVRCTVGCLTDSYKDKNIAVNTVVLVAIHLHLFVRADVEVKVCLKKKVQSSRESELTFRARISPKCQDFVFTLRCHVPHWPLTDACICSGDKWHPPTTSWLWSLRTFTRVCDLRAMEPVVGFWISRRGVPRCEANYSDFISGQEFEELYSKETSIRLYYHPPHLQSRLKKE